MATLNAALDTIVNAERTASERKAEEDAHASAVEQLYAEHIVLQAGRELDKLIAEVVFDYSDFWEYGDILMGYSPQERRQGIDAERTLVPQFSTNIHAAVLILQHMGKRWPDFSLVQAYEGEYLVWSVSWGFDGWGWETISAPTMELALARAAVYSTRLAKLQTEYLHRGSIQESDNVLGE